MTFLQQRRVIPGDTPGTGTDLIWYEAGPVDAVAKVYMQAALHADEQPGTMVLHHLLPKVREADAEGRLKARFVVLPMVNPLGMANFSFRAHLGRYDPNTGVNYNRRWPDLFAAIGENLSPRLTADAASNLAVIRNAIAGWLADQTPQTAAQQLRLMALNLAHDADYVLDLHCDSDSLMHIFATPEMLPGLQDLADWMGAAATLTAEDSGGGSFDEVLPLLYRQLAAANPGKPVPMGAKTATLEYRGRADTSDALGAEDARRLLGFLIGRGLVEGDAGPRPEPAPAPTSLDATDVVRATRPGLLAYRVELGERVTRGQAIADLIALDGPDAFIGRMPILSETDGFVLSRLMSKYVRRGENIAKIVGTRPLASRSGYLLED